MQTPAPIRAKHGGTMVIDSRTLFVGTFNLDPGRMRSIAEVFVIPTDPQRALQSDGNMLRDIAVLIDGLLEPVTGMLTRHL